MSQEICPLLHPYPCAANSPSVLPLVIPGSQLRSSLCFTLCRWGRAEQDCRAGEGRRGLLLPVSHFYHCYSSHVSSPRQKFLPVAAQRVQFMFSHHMQDGLTEPILETPAPVQHAALQSSACQLRWPSSQYLIFANPGLLPAPHPALGWELPTTLVPQCSLFTLSVTLLRILYLANKSSY